MMCHAFQSWLEDNLSLDILNLFRIHYRINMCILCYVIFFAILVSAESKVKQKKIPEDKQAPEKIPKDKQAEKIPDDKALAKVDSLLKEIQDILKREALQIRKEKEAFDLAAKKLKHVHFSSTVKLNVGGQIFTTSLQTLTKDAGSMLHAMFSDRFDTKPAEDGSYFIDRDGTCFRHILNYLRTGKLLLPDDELVKREVLEEAKFYQIQGIIDELDPKPYSDSLILSLDQSRWLAAVHGDNKVFIGCSLLYRASRDGWRSSNFHSKCDSFNGPTMVVIKSTGGYIFGGYTEQNWSGFGEYKFDPSAFLFSLFNPVGAAQIKIRVRHGYEKNAIYCQHDKGPTFGRGGGRGHDLVISDNPHSNQCSVDIGQTYELPAGRSSSFLTGSRYFTVAEMEVYGLWKDGNNNYCHK